MTKGRDMSHPVLKDQVAGEGRMKKWSQGREEYDKINVDLGLLEVN